jgi:hypothetical protein
MFSESVMLPLVVLVSGLIVVVLAPCATETEETTTQYNLKKLFSRNIKHPLLKLFYML